jgi:hypothetical protein
MAQYMFLLSKGNDDAGPCCASAAPTDDPPLQSLISSLCTCTGAWGLAIAIHRCQHQHEHKHRRDAENTSQLSDCSGIVLITTQLTPATALHWCSSLCQRHSQMPWPPGGCCCCTLVQPAACHSVTALGDWSSLTVRSSAVADLMPAPDTRLRQLHGTRHLCLGRCCRSSLPPWT